MAVPSGAGPIQRQAAVSTAGDGAAQSTSPSGGWNDEQWSDAAIRGTPVQAKAGGTASEDAPAPSGSGSAMPEAVQAKMESAFGADFSSVRIHEGAQASAMGALAYTQGTDVHFAPGHYQPGSQSGQELLGHELAHVVQQSQGRVQATTQAKGVEVNDDSSLEREADEMGARAARGEPVGTATSGSLATSGGAVVQRFESDEHREIGDDATKGDKGQVRSVQLAADYNITYGEMVAMAGDFFASLSQMQSLAKNVGTGAGTREEIEYVRVVKVHGHESKESKFSEAARKAADKRYYQLAANNRSHFLNPETGDEKKSVSDKADDTITVWEGWKRVKKPSGATGYYRQYHIQALEQAAKAGRAGASIDAAMAAEAFGGHYLTDMFAAGHQRTPRGSIGEYWNARVPMFFHNFKGYMAENLAKYINDHNTGLGMLTVPFLFEQSLGTLNETLASKGMPDFTFGDLVSGSVHDYDNVKGVDVTIDGASKTLYGDGKLGKGDTKSAAMAAVQAGVADVERAYEIAKGGGDDASVLAALYTDDHFAPERLIPDVKPNSQQSAGRQSLPWKFSSASALIKDSRFQEGLKMFLDEKKAELENIGSELDAEYKREAFQNGIVAKLDSAPVQAILDVINWTPDLGGGASGDADAKAREYLGEARKEGARKTLTYYQRYNLMVDLLDGPTVGDDEDAIMEILETAPDADARRLIKDFGWKRLYDEIDDGPGEEFKERFPKSTYQ